MNLRPLNLALAVLLSATASAQAQSLLQMYEAAKGHDAAYSSAKSQAQASLAKADQAKAALLPTVSASVSENKSELERRDTGATTADYTTRTNAISLNQPLFRWGNIASYRQGLQSAKLADTQALAAEQDLIVRTSQAYFDALTSAESLAFVKAQKTAVAEQLASAKRNFEVGTSTITDTREAQARYDLVIALELAAENDLRVKQLALEQLVGKNKLQPVGLKPKAVLPTPQPQDIEAWVKQALEQNIVLQQLRVAYEVARLETEKSKAGHMPTLDLTASYAQNIYSGNKPASIPYDTNVKTVGVSLNIPVFAGFATENRIKESVALEEKARADLEAAQRTVEQNTRAAYLGLITGLSQVKAYEAAEASSQSALDANKLGYQVGVRINIDVLNSQSQLYQTKRDLAKARYDVLLGQLKLRQAAGVLKAEDLQSINALLAP